MNKIVKGSIAGAAGIALLLGGAGTFALWNDQASVAPASIVSGQLKFNSTAPTGGWYNVTKSAAGTTVGGTFLVVPGETLEYRTTLSLKASGTNLAADLTVNAASLPTNLPAGYTLTTQFLNPSSGASVTSGTGNSARITNVSTDVTVDVVLKLTFNANNTASQNSTATLGTVKFDLQQLDPTTLP